MASILIIEDEISIAELERDYLELSGFEVEIETSGTSGLERALKEDFNLIILDLMLPGIDGFDICKKVLVLVPMTIRQSHLAQVSLLQE